jgi:lipopolysaccharide biosynthesis protein
MLGKKADSLVRPIAFYLPQFHPVEINDRAWGPGFTEWTNVAKATPNFQGHYQPHIPRDLGFYDLRLPEVLHKQAELASRYGIYGFCFYFYSFSGKRLLEKPLDLFVSEKVKFPFCICWANENWTKRWDGSDHDILIGQTHKFEDDARVFDDFYPYIIQDNYIKVDGLPLVIVYRPDILEEPARVFEDWRARAVKSGLSGLHIAVVNFYGVDNPHDFGADSLVEFPPHNYINEWSTVHSPPSGLSSNFKGTLVDYRGVMVQSMKRSEAFSFFPAVMPSWDNTARRQNTPHTFLNSSPELFGFWSRVQTSKAVRDPSNPHNFLFVNAWNEWGEGCHLEPCLKYGHEFLVELQSATKLSPTSSVLNFDPILQSVASVSSVTENDVYRMNRLEQQLLTALHERASLARSLQLATTSGASSRSIPPQSGVALRTRLASVARKLPLGNAVVDSIKRLTRYGT